MNSKITNTNKAGRFPENPKELILQNEFIQLKRRFIC